MNYKYKLILCCFCISVSQMEAQSIYEALRYSTTTYGSTARAAGMGGGFSGLGADVSVASSNPAGLAEFRRSEFTIGGSMIATSANSRLNGGQERGNSGSFFDLQNLAYVSHNQPYSDSWKTSNFVISLNRIATFSNRFEFNGSSPGSITDRFLANAQGSTPNDLGNFETGPAWVVGAIYNYDDVDTEYFSDFEGYEGPVNKNQVVETGGGITELALSYGGNYKEKISIGFSLGFPLLSYREEKVYTENDPSNDIASFNSLEFGEDLETTGFGINAKLGFLIKPSRQIRIGAAIHTPSWYVLQDDFVTDITYSFDAGNGSETFNEPSPLGEFRYRLTTPWRAILSGAYLLRTDALKGFITGELEYVNYAASNFDLTFDSNSAADALFESELNRSIDRQFQSAMSIKLGTELAFSKWRARGGVGLIGSPYTSSEDGSISNSLHLGAGWRGNNMYVDVAAVRQSSDRFYTPYIYNPVPQDINVSNNNLLFSATVGFKL